MIPEKSMEKPLWMIFMNKQESVLKDDCETFNGLLIHPFEKVPGKDEVKELEIGSVKITGIEVSRHQVVSAVVSK